jgi:fucose permease
VDHALDVLAGPATLVAGVVASAAVMTELPPAVLWPVAVIAGGGAAGLTKGSTALLRAKSGLATGGLANPVVSTIETVGATGIALLAIAVPVLCFVAVVALLWWAARKAGRLLFGRRKVPPPPAAT